MIRRLARRLAESGAAFVGLVVAVFFLSRLTGNPASLYLPINASQELRDRFAEQHGFNEPLWEQFVSFVSGLARLDFGMSLAQDRPAIEPVLEALPWTLMLAAITMAIAIMLALPIGAAAAMRPGSLFDRLATNLSLAAASVPDFWLALMGILVISVWLGLLPVSGTGTPLHWALPVATLVARPLGVLVQVTRGALVGELSATYIQAARAKGVGERTLTFVHAMRNAVAPVITVAGDQAATIVNGAVVVETIFGWPGIGRLMIASILRRDFAVILASIVVTAAAIFILNFVIDLLYAWANPRLRVRGAEAAA
jgi:peptide/nickel transport system permease protein